jgi:16S rRNA (cytosine967-C5)-methyltransferase
VGVKLSFACNDARNVCPEWLDSFDLVLCDVPCSGLGIKSKPDIMLKREERDIVSLQSIQKEILSVSAKYVRKGGFLCYSTCTVLKEENEDIVNEFLAENKNFSLSKIESSMISSENGMYNYDPDRFIDIFFVARLVRND